MITVDCVSDLHGYYPELEGGDLLIVAGDLTAHDCFTQWQQFATWISRQKYSKKIFISGNHDNYLYQCGLKMPLVGPQDLTGVHYIQDEGIEFEGLKIWGSPWTKRFAGMNPSCMAFTVDTDEELAEKWALIPEDTDILVTHGPPKSVLDWNAYGENCGSTSLLMKSTSLENLKLFAFGHIHEAHGLYRPEEFIEFEQANKHIFEPAKCKSMPYIANASHVNERYEPVNKPIRVEL